MSNECSDTGIMSCVDTLPEVLKRGKMDYSVLVRSIK